MKRLGLFLTVLLIAAMLVSPALAKGKSPTTPTPPKAPRGTFALVGYVRAIDAQAGTITVEVLKGNNLVQPYIGQQLLITVTATTRYVYTDGTTSTPIKFSDLKVNDPVSVNGTTANNVWKADRVTVGASLKCLP